MSRRQNDAALLKPGYGDSYGHRLIRRAPLGPARRGAQRHEELSAILGYGDGEPGELVNEVAFQRPVENGKLSYFQSGGGGGWRDPLDRDPHRVLEDVHDEYVSIEGACHDYGVVIVPETMTIDADATERRRAQLREARQNDPSWLALGRRRALTAAGVLEPEVPA